MRKYLQNTVLGVLTLTLAIAFVGCSDLGTETSNPADPNEPSLATGVEVEPSSEEDKFVEDLENGEYEFAIDEQTGELEPLDGVTIPSTEAKLYDKFLEESEIPVGKQEALTRTACSALSNYWRYAVYREICYALSRTKYHQGQWGQSTRTYSYYGLWLAGDWNYRGLGRGIGGWCKDFARTIVRRATGNRYNLPSGYNYAHGNIGWCRPGDVIQRPTQYGTPHTAIVFRVIQRDSRGRAIKIDVIDSNFIGGNRGRRGIIARHYFPIWSWSLWQFRVW